MFQAQRKGATSPGNWFTPIKPINAEHAEEMLNIIKHKNFADELSVYIVKEELSVYAGKVAGGTGHQIFVPLEIPLSEVLEEIEHIKNFRSPL